MPAKCCGFLGFTIARHIPQALAQERAAEHLDANSRLWPSLGSSAKSGPVSENRIEIERERKSLESSGYSSPSSCFIREGCSQ